MEMRKWIPTGWPKWKRKESRKANPMEKQRQKPKDFVMDFPRLTQTDYLKWRPRETRKLMHSANQKLRQKEMPKLKQTVIRRY